MDLKMEEYFKELSSKYNLTWIDTDKNVKYKFNDFDFVFDYMVLVKKGKIESYIEVTERIKNKWKTEGEQKC